MKKVGYIEKTSHALSAAIWRKLIDEIPELERESSDPGLENLLHAFLLARGERVGEFDWSDDDEEIVVKGELDEVCGMAEQIAVRLGGRFSQCL